MSKAILVLDEMPESCLHCQFAVTSEEDISVLCTAAEKKIADSWLDLAPAEWDPESCKSPDWCPLEELPEPLEPSSEDTKAFEEEFAEWHLVKWNKGFREGWNCCLNKIGGSDGRIQNNA